MYAVLVEGGKTRTIAVVMNERGEVVEHHIGGPSGWTTLGFDAATRNLIETVRRVLEKASIMDIDVKYYVFGLSDVDTEKARLEYLTRLREWWCVQTSKILLIPDHVVAYNAVTFGEPGIVVIAGTGSVAYGRNSQGVEARVGGWGWFGGDEGSSIWIAMKALNAVYRDLDGRGPRTLITKKLLELLKVAEPLEITDFVYSKIREDVGELGKIATLVDEAASEGDWIAQQILEEAGRELALHVKTVYDKINNGIDVFNVGGVGGVFSSKVVQRSFTEHVKKYALNTTLRSFIADHKPITGLAVIVAELLGVSKEKTINSLMKTLSLH